MFAVLDQQERLTGNQKRIILAAILGDALAAGAEFGGGGHALTIRRAPSTSTST